MFSEALRRKLQERVGIGADPAGFLRAGASRSLAAWVAAGYYVLDAARGVVRPTWKGAAIVSWRLRWPVRPMFRARRRQATRRLIDRLGISLEGCRADKGDATRR